MLHNRIFAPVLTMAHKLVFGGNTMVIKDRFLFNVVSSDKYYIEVFQDNDTYVGFVDYAYFFYFYAIDCYGDNELISVTFVPPRDYTDVMGLLLQYMFHL